MTRVTRAIRFLAIALLLISPAGFAGAQSQLESLSAATQQAIVAVIQDQLRAFQRDDGAAAFAHASPTIRGKFGTPERFMDMVRQGYGAVYRPQEVEFLEARAIGGRTGQALRVVGPDGQAVIAVYWMEQQPDGSWAISGVTLVPAEESYS